MRALHQQLNAEVHYLTKSAFASVVHPNPYLAKVYTIDGSLKQVLPKLRQESYDAVVDLHRNLRSLRVKLSLKKVPAYSFDKLNLEKWLLVRLKIDRLPDVHIVDRYLAAAGALGVNNDGQGLDYFIEPSDEVDVAALLQSGGEEIVQAIEPLAPAPAFTAVVIGAAHATKRLPTDRLIDFCRHLSGPLILLGGPTDADVGIAIADAVGNRAINACGRLRLNQSASVLRQSARVLSHDTGLMHIAAAFRRPIVSVWGNTIPEFGMSPYYPAGMDLNHSLEVSGLSCRPCSKIGYSACPKGHFRCMREQDPSRLPTAW